MRECEKNGTSASLDEEQIDINNFVSVFVEDFVRIH